MFFAADSWTGNLFGPFETTEQAMEYLQSGDCHPVYYDETLIYELEGVSGTPPEPLKNPSFFVSFDDKQKRLCIHTTYYEYKDTNAVEYNEQYNYLWVHSFGKTRDEVIANARNLVAAYNKEHGTNAAWPSEEAHSQTCKMCHANKLAEGALWLLCETCLEKHADITHYVDLMKHEGYEYPYQPRWDRRSNWGLYGKQGLYHAPHAKRGLQIKHAATFTVAEHKLAIEAAKHSGVSCSEYMRRVILEQAQKDVDAWRDADDSPNYIDDTSNYKSNGIKNLEVTDGGDSTF